MLRYFHWQSKRQATQWARSLLPKPGNQQVDGHCRQEVMGSLAKDKSRSHSSSSQGQGPHTCSHKWDPDLPAIIGRELLVRGAAQDVMKIMRSGNSLVEALQQPVSAFLAGPEEQPFIPKKSDLGPPSFHELVKEVEEAVTAQNQPKSINASLGEELVNIGRQMGIKIEPTEDSGISLELATKRTYQPSTIIRKRRHGFLSRLRSVGGRRVINRRRHRGRRKITA